MSIAQRKALTAYVLYLIGWESIDVRYEYIYIVTDTFSLIIFPRPMLNQKMKRLVFILLSSETFPIIKLRREKKGNIILQVFICKNFILFFLNLIILFVVLLWYTPLFYSFYFSCVFFFNLLSCFYHLKHFRLIFVWMDSILPIKPLSNHIIDVYP